MATTMSPVFTAALSSSALPPASRISSSTRTIAAWGEANALTCVLDLHLYLTSSPPPTLLLPPVELGIALGAPTA